MFFGGDPFGGGGFPGGGGMGRRREPADTQKLYDVLGVKKSDDTATIKKAYKKLAMKKHPDRGGDPAEFQEIQEAAEILTDEKKRAAYDRGGVEAASESRGERRKKGPASKSKITCTLQEIYMGKQRRMQITRKVIDKSSVSTCRQCGGQGQVIQMMRMGPMVQQMQTTCDACRGQGSSFKQQTKSEILEVHVPKGAPNGHKLVYNEKANEIPDGDAGDVIITVVETPHEVFKRKGDDLYLSRKISLSDALCGFEMEVKHLDGRVLIVKSKPGDVIKPVAYDPFDEGAPAAEWECFEGKDCPGIEGSAEGRTDDPDRCKEIVTKGQLKDKGIGCFVLRGGRAVFKQCSREEALSSAVRISGSTMWVLGDASTAAAGRMMKAVEGEGMPRLSNPFEKGNLFIQFDIVFPTALSAEAQAALLTSVPKMHKASSAADGAGVEVVTLSEVDPYSSYHDHLPEKQEDSDDEEGGDGRGVQCAQS